MPSSGFCASELDPERAKKAAQGRKAFWMLVYSGQGLSYSDIKGMDLAEYQEAIEARILYNEEWGVRR